jgi:hypothetical protein
MDAMRRFFKWLLFLDTADKLSAAPALPEDPHIACRASMNSLAQQRDIAIGLLNQATEANVKMAVEIVRLSELATPAPVDPGELPDLPSTRDNDRDAGIVLNDPERLRRPAPGRPERVAD